MNSGGTHIQSVVLLVLFMVPSTWGSLTAYQRRAGQEWERGVEHREGFKLQSPEFLSMDVSLWPSPSPGNMASSHLRG